MCIVLDSQLIEIARHAGRPCLSVLFPVDLRHPDPHGDEVLAGELVATARRRLAELGPTDRELPPVDPAALRREAGARSASGVAVFLAPGWQAEVYAGTALPVVADAGDRPYLLPLVAAAEPQADVHVLTAGAGEVALYRLTDGALVRVPVAGLPPSADEALWFERRERHVGAHAGGPGGSGGTSIVHHGAGGTEDDRKARLERYFRLVDDLVLDVAGTAGSLLVVGTGTTVAQYQRVSRHPWLIGLPLGSPAELRPHELLAGVAEVAEAGRKARAERAVGRYASLAGTGRATGDPDEVAAAAAAGRVEVLLTAPELLAVGAPSGAWLDGGLQRANAAVVDACRTGATVVAAEPATQPPTPLAAILRY